MASPRKTQAAVTRPARTDEDEGCRRALMRRPPRSRRQPDLHQHAASDTGDEMAGAPRIGVDWSRTASSLAFSSIPPLPEDWECGWKGAQGLRVPLFRLRFGISKLSIPPMVAVFLDQPARFGQRNTVAEEAGAGKLNVGLEQRHRSPLGDLPCLVQVRPATRLVTR